MKTDMQLTKRRFNGRLFGRLVDVSDVPDSQLQQMFGIFERYYDNVSWPSFRKDFREKSRVILLFDRRTGLLQGFTTLKTFRSVVQGKEVAGLFSGDTVVEREYWGQPALRATFFRAMLVTWWENLLESKGRRPFYWFLISKGYKTYLLLTNNFQTHWPRYNVPMPDREREIMRTFADSLYPGRANERELKTFTQEKSRSIDRALVLPFDQGAPCLREEVAPIRHDLLTNPKIRFFQIANPGWEEGHELCCLAPISPTIFAHFIWRLFYSTAKRSFGFRGSRRSKAGRVVSGVTAVEAESSQRGLT
jgi:hypothetical protein